MSQTALGNLELGQRRLDVAEFVAIARVLGIDEVALFRMVLEPERAEDSAIGLRRE